MVISDIRLGDSNGRVRGVGRHSSTAVADSWSFRSSGFPPVESKSHDSGHLSELVIGRAKTDLDPLKFSAPTHPCCFPAALYEIGSDGFESVSLNRIGAEHRASDAGVFVDAGGAVAA